MNQQVIFENENIVVSTNDPYAATLWNKYGKVRVYLDGSKMHLDLTEWSNGNLSADVPLPTNYAGGEQDYDFSTKTWSVAEYKHRFGDTVVRVEVK